MNSLSEHEIDSYFEGLSEPRRDLFWLRVDKQLGQSRYELDESDPAADQAFNQVVRQMWASDQLERLCEMGLLKAEVDSAGRRCYVSASQD